jgi:hypothetical protein
MRVPLLKLIKTRGRARALQQWYGRHSTAFKNLRSKNLQGAARGHYAVLAFRRAICGMPAAAVSISSQDPLPFPLSSLYAPPALPKLHSRSGCSAVHIRKQATRA